MARPVKADRVSLACSKRSWPKSTPKLDADIDRQAE